MKRKIIYLFLLCLLFPVQWLVAQVPEDEVIITASSVLPPGGTSDYKAANVMDGASDSWSEGAPGPGVGATLHFEMRYPDRLRYVMIKNGFGKPGYWHLNARVKAMRITDRYGTERVIFPEDTPGLRVYGLFVLHQDENGVHADRALLRGDEFTFEITDVYPGDRWEDLCISEIGFNQWYYGDLEMEESYIIRNLYMEYLEGIYNEDGELLVESAWDGLERVDIRNGYYMKEIQSGDGTTGWEQYQTFIDRQRDIYLMLYSSERSEISQASMEGALDDNGEPFRTRSYSFKLERYDPGMGVFREVTGEAFMGLFEICPDEAISEATGTRVGIADLQLSVEEPGILKVWCPECPGLSSSFVSYTWNDGLFRLRNVQQESGRGPASPVQHTP